MKPLAPVIPTRIWDLVPRLMRLDNIIRYFDAVHDCGLSPDLCFQLFVLREPRFLDYSTVLFTVEGIDCK